jgi:hypothetical protein
MEERVMDIPQLSQDENILLIANFTEEEVFEAISQMERISPPDLMVFGRVLSTFLECNQGRSDGVVYTISWW